MFKTQEPSDGVQGRGFKGSVRDTCGQFMLLYGKTHHNIAK